eukprot:scaffold21846_cov26-Tisochrysis_lutea.AAC.3
MSAVQPNSSATSSAPSASSRAGERSLPVEAAGAPLPLKRTLLHCKRPLPSSRRAPPPRRSTRDLPIVGLPSPLEGLLEVFAGTTDVSRRARICPSSMFRITRWPPSAAAHSAGLAHTLLVAALAGEDHELRAPIPVPGHCLHKLPPEPTAQPEHVAPELVGHVKAFGQPLALGDRPRRVVLLKREVHCLHLQWLAQQHAQQRQPVLAQEREQPLGDGGRPDWRGTLRVGSAHNVPYKALVDDALLSHVRVEEEATYESVQLLNGKRRRPGTLQHRIGGHLLSNRGDHREHQRIARNEAPFRIVRHALANVPPDPLDLSRAQACTQTRSQHVLLLLHSERHQLGNLERAEPPLVHATRARCRHNHVPLRHEHARDVPLKEAARVATLVEPVKDEHGAPAQHRLAQHALHGRLAFKLHLHIRIHPVPCSAKVSVSLGQPSLPQLTLDQDGHHLRLAAERRLARRRICSDEHARWRRPSLLLVTFCDEPLVASHQPRQQRLAAFAHRRLRALLAVCRLLAACGGQRRGLVAIAAHEGHFHGDALLHHAQLVPGERISDTRVRLLQRAQPPVAHAVKRLQPHLERRVVPWAQLQRAACLTTTRTLET